MIKLYAGKNIRDIGGLSCAYGKIVQYGRIYRGAAFPSSICQEDLDVLRKELEATSNANYEDDEYFKKMNSRKRLVDRILEQSNNGSVKDIILEKPKE